MRDSNNFYRFPRSRLRKTANTRRLLSIAFITRLRFRWHTFIRPDRKKALLELFFDKRPQNV